MLEAFEGYRYVGGRLVIRRSLRRDRGRVPDIRAGCAGCHVERGDHSKAREYYKRALQERRAFLRNSSQVSRAARYLAALRIA